MSHSNSNIVNRFVLTPGLISLTCRNRRNMRERSENGNMGGGGPPVLQLVNEERLALAGLVEELVSKEFVYRFMPRFRDERGK